MVPAWQLLSYRAEGHLILVADTAPHMRPCPSLHVQTTEDGLFNTNIMLNGAQGVTLFPSFLNPYARA